MIRYSHRKQRTIGRPAEVEGIGFVTGADIRLRFLPAPPSSGIYFVRTDLAQPVTIPAHVDQVSHTQRRTTLGNPETGQVELVEHVLAALAGMRIDNCRVEINGIEAPGMNGSAKPFVDAIREAGVECQSATRTIWAVDQPVVVSTDRGSMGLYPSDQPGLKISYFLDYGHHPSLSPHRYTQTIDPIVFAGQIAPSRTFILESEVEMLRGMGLGSRTTPADLLVFGSRGVIGNRTYWADEPARHKVLDIVGDLSLLGVDLQGHVIGCHTGHPQNVNLVQLLNQQLVKSLARKQQVA